MIAVSLGSGGGLAVQCRTNRVPASQAPSTRMTPASRIRLSHFFIRTETVQGINHGWTRINTDEETQNHGRAESCGGARGFSPQQGAITSRVRPSPPVACASLGLVLFTIRVHPCSSVVYLLF